jgi:predicted  nucleic acid-binding Zn-ribbon protein
MLPVLEKLLILQERDEKLTQLQDELLRLPKEEEALEKKWQAASARLEQLKGGLKQLEVERKKLDLDATAKRDQIGKYKTQQLQTRKNEEFSALNNEISHAEKDIVGIEDKELDLMERISEMEKQVAAEQGQLTTQEAQIVKQREDFKIRRVRLDEEVARVKGLQGEAEQAVEAEGMEGALARYRRIFASKKKQALVPINHGACGGCHMKLTFQTVASAKGKEIMACENCGRLLYTVD